MIWVVHAQYSYYDDHYEPRLVAYFDGQNAQEEAENYATACTQASVHRSFVELDKLDPGGKNYSRKERTRTTWTTYPCDLRNPLP